MACCQRREIERKYKIDFPIPREEEKPVTPFVRLLRAFCCIYIHMQIVLLGGRANAIDEAAEASRRQGSVDTIRVMARRVVCRHRTGTANRCVGNAQKYWQYIVPYQM